MILQDQHTDFLTAQNWHLTLGGQFQRSRTNNLIIHPNGKLYGELVQMGYHSWRLEGDRLIFEGRNPWDTWEFCRSEDGGWIGWPSNVHRLTVPAYGTPEAFLASGAEGHQLKPLPEITAGKDRFEIVVAKHHEDVAWTDCYRDTITIYSKDPGDIGVYPVLPNLGRDAGTQLYHIVERYDDLADRTLFLQGHPWDHPTLPIPRYATDDTPFTTASTIENSVDWSPHWTKPGQTIDGSVMRAFLELIGCDSGIRSFRWTQGMQFAASRQQIRRRSLDYYCRMFDLSQKESVELAGRRFDNLHIIFLFELFWRNVFREA